MKEEILKQIEDKFPRLAVSSNHSPWDRAERVDFNPIDLIMFIHNNALKMVEEGLPTEEIAQFGRENSWEMEHANGHNSCREQVINNINKLKI